MGLIEQLQELVAERIRTTPDLCDGDTPLLPVVTEDVKDLEAEVGKALNKVGAGITVLTPEWKRGDEFTSLQIFVDVEIVENPSVNRGPAGTGLSILRIAQTLQHGLHLWTPSGPDVEEGVYARLEFVQATRTSAATPLVLVLRFETHVFNPTIDPI